MSRRLLVALATVLLACGLVSCSKDGEKDGAKDYGFQVVEVEVNGPGTLGLSEYGHDVKGLLVYFHGSDQTARVIRDDEKHRNLFDPALRSGYAVVAADAGGNAFGNPASQQQYRRLIAAAREKYGAVPVFFVAESMGALAALTLLREDQRRAGQGHGGGVAADGHSAGCTQSRLHHRAVGRHGRGRRRPDDVAAKRVRQSRRSGCICPRTTP